MKGQEPIPEAQGFVSALFSLGIACHPLIERLHRIIAQALQLDDIEYFNNVSKAFSDPTVTSYSTIRSIFYPPITKDVTPGSVRCAPHSDYGTITLLFQDEIGGLEVNTFVLLLRSEIRNLFSIGSTRGRELDAGYSNTRYDFGKPWRFA